jgi:bacterioferritin (cytochrome b1)
VTLKDAIEKLNADLVNERAHLAFYLCNASSIGGLPALEYRELFEQAAAGEMKHVLAFQDRIYGLGGTPGTAVGEYQQFDSIVEALAYAIQLESEVVANYTRRLEELDALEEAPAVRAYLKVFYEDQLRDSYEDCERLRRLYPLNTVPEFPRGRA